MSESEACSASCWRSKSWPYPRSGKPRMNTNTHEGERRLAVLKCADSSHDLVILRQSAKTVEDVVSLVFIRVYSWLN